MEKRGSPADGTYAFLDRVYILAPMQQLCAKFLMTMKDYPPSQSPGSFNLEKVQKQIEASLGGK
jgi:arylsulfatase